MTRKKDVQYGVEFLHLYDYANIHTFLYISIFYLLVCASDAQTL